MVYKYSLRTSGYGEVGAQDLNSIPTVAIKNILDYHIGKTPIMSTMCENREVSRLATIGREYRFDDIGFFCILSFYECGFSF